MPTAVDPFADLAAGAPQQGAPARDPFADLAPGGAAKKPDPFADLAAPSARDSTSEEKAPPPPNRPAAPVLAPRDATRTGPAPANPQATDLRRGNLAARSTAAALEAGAHPLETAASVVTAPAKALKTGAQFIAQSAAETSLPDDVRARALADPDRISEKDALIAAAQLATIPAARVLTPAARALSARVIGTEGAVAAPIAASRAAKVATSLPFAAAAGATFSPDDPAVGAVVGTAAGAVHAASGKALTRSAKPAAALTPEGAEERAAGASIPANVRAAAGTILKQATTNPNAPIADAHPSLDNAIQGANAMPPQQAGNFVRQLGRRVLQGLTPDQAEAFETARVAANLETEASRKANGASALSTQAVAHRMEVRQFAKRDLDAETARAAAVLKAGMARADAAGKNAPPQPGTPPEMDPATTDAIDAAHATYDAGVQAHVASTLQRAAAQRDAAIADARSGYQDEASRARDAFAVPADRDAHLASHAAARDAAIGAARATYETTKAGARAEADAAFRPTRDAAIADATAQSSDQLRAATDAYATQRAAYADHGNRVGDLVRSAQLDADDILKPAQADYDLAIRMGDKAHDAAQLEAFGKKQAAVRATQEAAAMRQRVPAGIEQQQWFQDAVARHQAMVEPFNEAAAVRAGVDPAALRRTAVGYTRLTPQDQLNEQAINRTQDIAATDGKGAKALTPRTGVLRKLFGQKRDVVQVAPAGTETPLQGPADVRRATASSVVAPAASTAETGSAKAFTGATNYSTDYLTNIARDAADKVSKAQQNAVYRAVASGAGRLLPPDERPAPGERIVAFDDRKQLVEPPDPSDPTFHTVQRYAVSKDVADRVAAWRARPDAETPAGKALRAGAGAVTRATLSNPLVAAGHSLTLASNVSRGLPAGAGALETAVTGLPGIKSAHALTRAARVDFADPPTVERLQRLALSGGLRLSDERGHGVLSAVHHALFGPSGVDTRMRLVASEDAEYAWTKAGGSMTDPAFLQFERDAVNGHSGNYIAKNQGTMVRALQESGMMPFIAINRAKLEGSVRALAGGGGPPNTSIGDRILRAQRGPLGQAAILAGASYLVSGHSPAENAPGHETDVATGVYHLADGSYRYFRGDPADAIAQLGAGAKEVYLRKGFMDASSAAAIRLIEPIAYAKKGDKVSEAVRAAANTALAWFGPAPVAGAELGLGLQPYVDRDGALGSVQGLHLNKDADLTDRLVSAARNTNAVAALSMPAPTGGARSAVSSALGNLDPFAEGDPQGRAKSERHDVTAWEDAKVKQIYGEKDATKRAALMHDALEEAAASGYDGPKLRATLQKAVVRAGVDRSASAETKFENQIKGAAATRDANTHRDVDGSLGGFPNPFVKKP